ERKGTGAGVKEKALTVEGSDPADLLINFLREILYLFNGERRIVISCSIVMLGKRKLVANLALESYNSKRHLIKTELKAVTYHGLSVERMKKGWKARVIFDV
ncbi:MAG TPA: hypothetical protein DDY86_05025, partial [Syntrophaceae bacterium]|nr:hypothetical protein [Syntrophaceae bacterium]